MCSSARPGSCRDSHGGSAPEVVAIAERLDFHHEAVLEMHATHQPVGPEVVDPGFHRNLHEVLREMPRTAVDPDHRPSPDGTPLDVAGLAALGTHLGARVAFVYEARAAPKGLRGQGEREPDSEGDQRAHHGPHASALPLNPQ